MSEPSDHRLRLDVIKRSGLDPEFRDRVRAAVKADVAAGLEVTGQTYSSHSIRIAKDMVKEESSVLRAAYRDDVTELALKEQEESRLCQMEAERIVAHRDEFEWVFGKLPTKCSRADERDWIENHGKMILGGSDLELTVDDIRDAPSRSSVGQLRHWLENKAEFYKLVLTGKWSSSDGGGGDGAGDFESAEYDDPMIAELDRMIADMETRALSE